MKTHVLITWLLFLTAAASGQTINREQFLEIQKKLPREKNRAEKAELLYRSACYYLENVPFEKALDSAVLLNAQSIAISTEIGLKRGIAQSMLLEGRIETVRGNDGPADRLKQKALDYAQKYGLKKQEADVYIELAFNLGDDKMAEKSEYALKAVSLYKQAGTPYDQAEAFTTLAKMYHNSNEFDTSIAYLKQAVKIKRGIKRYDLYKEYTVFAQNYLYQGKYKEALNYALQAEKIAEQVKAEGEWPTVIYNVLGAIYLDLKSITKSIAYYKKAIALARKNNDTYAVNNITENTANLLYRLGKPAEALSLIDSELKYYPGKDCNVRYASIYIFIYCKLEKYTKARPYYEQLLKCGDDENISDDDRQTMYQAIINYLLKTRQAHKSYTYINKLKVLAKANNNVLDIAELEKTYYKADSASGDFLNAIRHLKNYKTLSDSIFNSNSTREFSELQLKYDTEKKDKSIKLLTEQSKLQEEKISNATILRYVFIAGLLLLLGFVALLYNRARLKQRTNKRLEAKQQKIDTQNEELKGLLSEKEGLLREKEWLIKEIHHRVKNNLQIIISLLNTQSAYLDNEDALLAIQNSQHRMHAMSLIHQKLYQSDNLATIDMSWYIMELVSYLQESFTSPQQNIYYSLDTDPLELDVTQAVPLGLILNEAISNAIKYAFEGRNSGEISISLKNLGTDTYCLTIADNGIGLPNGFELLERESLGINLMIGLADQLDGTIEMKNTAGLSIIVTSPWKKQLTNTREPAADSLN